MSEMIERVANAIQVKCKERGYPECPAPLVHHIAAAAIEAMREPNYEMRHADAVNEWPEDAEACWKAMIDAALSPSQT